MTGKLLLVLLLAAAAACGPRRTDPAPPVDHRGAALAELPTLEARRADGLARLLELSRQPDPELRARVARALGRTGGDAARARLLELVADADGEVAVRDSALWALGLAGDPAAAARLAALLGTLEPASLRAEAVRAIGRIGGVPELGAVAARLADGDPPVRAAAAVALGMYGRRGLAIDAAARSALAGAAGDADASVRLGVAFALAREHQPPSDAAVSQALVVLARDADAEVRATALSGLSKRGEVTSASFLAALDHPDWRVRVQAVSAAGGERWTAEDRAAAATRLAAEWARSALEPDGSPRTHVLAAGLRALASHAGEPRVREVVDVIADRSAATLAEGGQRPGALLATSMAHCLASAALVHAGEQLIRVIDCGGKAREGWPRHARRALAAELIGAGAGVGPTGDSAADRLVAWQQLVADQDPRVRASAIEAGVAAARRDEIFRGPVATVLGVAVFDKEIEVAGAAADAIAEALVAPELADAGWELGGRLVERASRGADDVELELTLLAAIGRGGVSAGAGQCERRLGSANRSVREAARGCLEALGRSPGDVEPAAAEPPAFVPAPATAPVVWTLETSRGRIVIDLDPARAPWHVAAIARLTRDGFYNGLMWHRVVPGFVVQGGSPRNSGWGGPGFALPAEPSPGRYDAGVVGIADAGFDTGGSQIFIMHARAPHLEGRYTIVGRIRTPQEVVDSIQVGDRIIRARIESQ